MFRRCAAGVAHFVYGDGVELVHAVIRRVEADDELPLPAAGFGLLGPFAPPTALLPVPQFYGIHAGDIIADLEREVDVEFVPDDIAGGIGVDCGKCGAGSEEEEQRCRGCG